MSNETHVYRLLDAGGRLLYVGMTHSLPKRLAQHAADKDWWGDVATVTLERHADRASAASAETAAIRAEQPAMNRQLMTGRDPLRAFRVPDRVWFAALAIARKRGLKLSEVLRKALEDLIEDDKK